jgi:hypothetical protein
MVEATTAPQSLPFWLFQTRSTKAFIEHINDDPPGAGP